MMTQKEIRESFLNFFKSKDHVFVPSSSLVPKQDPSILFTNSGMNQFKDIFLSLKEAKFPRVCNSQKCIRLSGKHNDLEEVGVDTYHHTFFEMLGNWSFGDFYKKEIITWSWELLTKIWKLPKDKLYATVYKDDFETADLWKSETDIDHTQIKFFGEKENFWEMAEVGPCGPCSEIHIDIGEESCTCSSEKKEICCRNLGDGVNQNCGRYIEIWNLVFIQYNREKDKTLTPLKKAFVDTGMGFERICAILQNKKSNYDTDIFFDLFVHIGKMCQRQYQSINTQEQIAFRVIADHIRAITFSITDGVTPSNEGRGYVIRRVLRRAYRYGKSLNLNKPFLHKLVPVVVKSLGNFFPELQEKEEFVTITVHKEEEAFRKTLDKGLSLFEKLLKRESNTKTLSGPEVFQLYDTYGFPFDLTKLLARERGYQVDVAVFEQEMKKQKGKSKKKKIDYDLIKAVSEHGKTTEYIGDSQYSCADKISIIFKNKKQVIQLTSGEDGILVFDKTVFYGESGGQVGDTGRIEKKDFNNQVTSVFEVTDTQKIEQIYLICGRVIQGKFQTGEECIQESNGQRREIIRKNHTATHILHQSLMNVLGEHTEQAGSLVNEEKLRFDFNHYEALSPKQLESVEKEVNEVIKKNISLTISEMDYTNALSTGAKAFFEEKYGDRVRVVQIGEFSTELCGGSHVKSSGEIGGFKITSESSVASGIRRIEAITGPTLVEDYFIKTRILEDIAKLLHMDRVELIFDTIKSLKMEMKQLSGYKEKIEEENLKKVLQQSKKTIGSASIYIKKFTNSSSSISLLKKQIDNIRNYDPNCVCFLSVQDNKKITFLAAIGKNMSQKIKAGWLVNKAAHICAGKGGGRDDFAQAGGQNLDKVNEAMEWVNQELIKKLR